MRSSKVISEDIDEVEAAFNREARIAKSTIALAKAEGRDLTKEETQTFDAAASSAKVYKEQLQQLRVELLESEQTNQQIIASSQYGGQHSGASNMNYVSNQTFTQNFPQVGSNLVLPVNGRPAGEHTYAGDYPQHRISKVRNFANARDALDAGMVVRAIVAKEYNRSDNHAHEYCKNRFGGWSVWNSNYEGSGPQGGYLVPAPLSNAIIDVRESVGVSRKICDVQPMTSDTLTIPKRASGLTVYAPGETNALTVSDKTFSQVELIAKRRGTASYISQELVDDALINVVDNVVSEMGYALGLQEDNELINGTGAATSYFGVRGLLNRIGAAGVSTAATGHDTWGEIDISDCAACIGLLPDRFHQYGASWVCSHSFYNSVFARIAFSAGGATMAEVFSGDANRKNFLGYPVFLTSQMPTATATATVCALFGSFSQAVVLGDRGGIRVSRSDDYQFLNDLTALKAVTRYDINVHNPGTASAVGAYVALKTAS